MFRLVYLMNGWYLVTLQINYSFSTINGNLLNVTLYAVYGIHVAWHILFESNFDTN